jgi:TPR repeat protein
MCSRTIRMSSSRAPSSLLAVTTALLLAGAQAALAQQKPVDAGAKCESLLRTMPVMRHPQMQVIFYRPGSTLGDLLEQLDKLGNGGDPDALYAIGRMQQYGICAQQSTAGALEYLTRAAQSGVRAAQEALGEAYYAGKEASPANRLDIPLDHVQSYMWFRVLDDRKALLTVRRRMIPSEVDEAERLAREQIARQTGKPAN